jgi:hypothetical protein
MPCAMTLSTTVHATTASKVLSPASSSLKTMTPNTMLASPRGLNRPMNSFSATLILVPLRHRNSVSIRTTVRLSTA